MNIKKYLSALLAICLLAGCLTGCGDKADGNTTDSKNNAGQTTADTLSSKYAYKATFTPLKTPDGEDLSYINSACVIGNQLYLPASYIDGKTTVTDDITGDPVMDETTGQPLETDNYVNGILRMDLETMQISKMDAFEPTPVPEGMNGSSSVEQVFAGLDGSLWVYEQLYTYTFDLPEDFDSSTQEAYDYYVPGDTKYILTNYSADGVKTKSVELELPEDTYLTAFYSLSDGRILGYDWQNAYLFDDTGKVADTIDLTDANGTLYSLGQDRFAVTSYDQATSQFMMKELDLETKKLTDVTALPISLSGLYPGFGEYDYLYRISDAVFGMKKGATEGEKLLSWMDCDVNSNNVNQFFFLDDGRIIAIEQDYNVNSSGCNLIVMEQVDPSTVKEKQVLTLGCLSLDWQLRSSIVEFNRSSDDVRIVVTDYSESITDGSYDTAMSNALQKLNTEILSGNMPDILCTDGLPVSQYAAKGLLEDLWPMIDNDATLSRDDLMTHFFDVLSQDGKLYQVSNSFSIQSAATYKEIANGRTSWTLDEMLEALGQLKEGAAIFGETDTSDNMLSTLVSFNLDSFMDWDAGTCSFDSQQFIDILNFAAQFPKEFDYNSYDWETAESPYTRMKNGTQLMVDANLYSFDSVQFTAALLDNRASYIGYPSETGNGSAFSCDGGMAISASCKDKDAAWSLVRTLLLEENQTEDYVYRFPTNKHAFETYKKKAMTPEYTTDPETGEQVEVSTGGIGYNDFSVDLYAIKQEDFDAFWALYESCNTVTSTNQEVTNLITDQAAAFLDGKKTAEETAKLIQDQVSLYMMEQG